MAYIDTRKSTKQGSTARYHHVKQRDSDGRSRLVKTFVNDKKGAQALVNKLNLARYEGTVVDVQEGRTKLEPYLTEYIVSRRTASSRNNYGVIARRYIFPELGSTELRKLSGLKLTRHFHQLRSDGVSNQNRIKAYVILHGVLAIAVEVGVLSKSPLPSRETCGIGKDVRESEMRYLTASQARGLVAAIDGEEQLLTDFMISTGARVSEAIEIRVGDLDLTRGVVLISRSATESHGVIEVKGTKSDKGRVVPLPAGLRDRLREHLNDTGRRFLTEELVFQTTQGHQIRPSNFRHRTLARASERAGLERVRPHDLRSTFASLCAHAGVDIYRVSKWLGHGSIAVTEKRYLGLFQQGSEDASAIDAVMSEVAQ